MKKIFLSLFVLAFAINISYAQWSTGTGIIYPTTSTDKIGIGTSSPSEKLSVDGNYMLQNSAANSKGYLFSSPTSNWGPSFSGLYFTPRDGVDGTQDFSIKLWDGTSGTPEWGNRPTRFFIDAAIGNVGIGTTTPNSRLQVSGTLSAVDFANTLGTSTPVIWGSIGNAYSTWGVSVNHVVENAGSNVYGMGLFTTDSYATGRTEKVRITGSGNVGIGTVNPDQKLTVKGTIHSQEVIVDMSVLPDYVFKPTYHLPTLNEIKTYIDQNHHLPEMPSAEQVAKDGLSLGDMNAKLLRKVEELTLYLIEKDKIITDQQKQITDQQEQINLINQQLELITKKLK